METSTTDTKWRDDKLERYRRQLGIEGWGRETQQKISDAVVTVAGAGGLGSPVLLFLAAAGIGCLNIVDGDIVSLSNLNRQVLYGDALIGRPKAEAAKNRILELNPTIKVNIEPVRLDSGNFARCLPTDGILVDCLDNFETRFLLNRQAVRHGLTLVHAGVQGFFGQLTTIVPGETACLECLYADEGARADMSRNAFAEAEGAEAVSVQSVGAVVGTLGSLQATEVLKVVTGIGNPLKNRLLVFDGLSARFDEIAINRNGSCPRCGEP